MKRISWYFLLLALCFGGDRIGAQLLEKQAVQSRFRFSRLYRGDAAAELLLLGNSRGLAFYQPHIEKITGKSTFNLSYNGLPMDAARALVLDYLERYPAPKNLLIDITACDRENDALLSGFLTYSGRSARLDQLIRRKLPRIWWGGQVSGLFRYNNEIFQRVLYYRNKTDTDWLLDRSISPELARSAGDHSYDLEPNPYLLQELREIVEAVRARGVRVTLLIGPYFPGFRVNKLDDLKQKAELATGLPVQDYRDALDNPADFGDFMHPNKKGSIAYMDLLYRAGYFD